MSVALSKGVVFVHKHCKGSRIAAVVAVSSISGLNVFDCLAIEMNDSLPSGTPLKEWRYFTGKDCVLYDGTPLRYDKYRLPTSDEIEVFGAEYRRAPGLVCQCGAQKYGLPFHSSWCPLATP